MQIYAEHRAGVTFLQALSDMLRTPCSSAACLDRVEALLSTSAGRELQLKKGIVEQLQPSRNPHTVRSSVTFESQDSAVFRQLLYFARVVAADQPWSACFRVLEWSSC